MVQRLVLVLLVVGCKPTVPNAPAATVTPEPATSEDALPALPEDLVPSLGDAHALLERLHAEPKPRRDEPFASEAEHAEWVARELDPWNERMWDDVVEPFGRAMPKGRPPADADDATWLAHQRVDFVYGVLAADLMLEAMVVQYRVPLPDGARDDPQLEPGLDRSHQLVEAYRHSCTTFDGGEQPIRETCAPGPRTAPTRSPGSSPCCAARRSRPAWPQAFPVAASGSSASRRNPRPARPAAERLVSD